MQCFRGQVRQVCCWLSRGQRRVSERLRDERQKQHLVISRVDVRVCARACVCVRACSVDTANDGTPPRCRHFIASLQLFSCRTLINLSGQPEGRGARE